MSQLLVGFVLIALAGQNDAPRNTQDLVTVSGCVRGNHLKLPSGGKAPVESLARASEYVLVAAKETLSAIRKHHDGHYLEVTGTLDLPPDPTKGVQIQEKQLGSKTRVTFGTRVTAGEASPLPVRLVVSSYRDLADQCHERDR